MSNSRDRLSVGAAIKAGRRVAGRTLKMARRARKGVRRARPVLRRVNQVTGGLLAASSVARRISRDETLDRLERLGGLRDKGIITAEEFEAKKAELLARI
jgi:hypothetical protein